MSDIRYQVFVSSTYADLMDERIAVSQALMEMNCIPAGMELFPATNEDQLDFIKTVIDDSDYYVLIIGGRYGSTDKEGVSYTEREFDYAISKNIEVCAFLHSNLKVIASGKTDIDPKLSEKLEAFKQKVSSGRLIKHWNDPKELPGKVVTSLNSAIRRKPAMGWVRGNRQTSPEFFNEYMALREENLRLKEQIDRERSKLPTSESNELNRPIRVDYHESQPKGLLSDAYGFDNKGYNKKIIVSVADIIERIGSKIADRPGKLEFLRILPGYKDNELVGYPNLSLGKINYTISSESEKRMELALTALGYAAKAGNVNEYMLSEKGRMALFEIMTAN